MCEPLAVAAVERCSSIAYLHALFDCHARGRILVAAAADVQPPAGTRIVERIACATGGGWFSERITPIDSGVPAQIVLTSGTTGDSKAILLSHRALADVTHRLIDVMQLDDGVREYVGVPVTHSFGFARVRAVAAVGGASFLPPSGFRVEEFATMLERGEVNALSAVPTLLRLILDQRARFAACAQYLRWIEIGSQPMRRDEKEALRALFPNARIILHYGLTEASRSTFLDISQASGDELDSVGCATGEVELRIDNGLIAIRGPHLATGVVTAQGVEALTGPDGWLVTRDLGGLRGGLLSYLGRSDEMINVAGIKISPDEFEAQLEARLGGAGDIAVTRAADALRGDKIIVAHAGQAVEPEALRAAALSVAKAFGAGDGVDVVHVDAIPRTETGKVRRAELERVLSDRPPTPVAAENVDHAADGIPQIFFDEFGKRARDASASFESLGGDSLQYVSVMLHLERYLPELPDDWDSLGVGDLCARAKQSNIETAPALATTTATVTAQRRSALRNLDSVRGLACLLVVAVHVIGVDSSQGMQIPAGSAWHSVMNALDLIRMPLFTALAGFLYGVMPAAREGYAPFVKRRARQLLIPLLVATPVFVILVGPIQRLDTSLIVAYAYAYRHLWYLYCLFYILALVGWVDTRTKLPQAAYWVAAGAIVASYWAMPDIGLLQVYNTLFLLPFFILGMMLHRTPAILRSRPLALIAFVVLGSVIAAQQIGGAWSAAAFVTWIPLFLAGYASVIAVFHALPRIAWLAWIGPYSFAIYLWHPLANGAVRNGLWSIGLHNISLLFCIGVAVGVLIPIAIHQLALRAPRFISLPLIGR